MLKRACSTKFKKQFGGSRNWKKKGKLLKSESQKLERLLVQMQSDLGLIQWLEKEKTNMDK